MATNTIGTGGDFDTIADWVSYLEGIGTLTEPEIGQCLGQSFDERIVLDRTVISTSVSNYVELTAHPNFRHNGRANVLSGLGNARIDYLGTAENANTMSIDINHFRLSWLEFPNLGGTNGQVGIRARNISGSGEHYYHHLILHNDGNALGQNNNKALWLDDSEVDFFVYRNIIYGFGGDGVYTVLAGANSVIYNTTSCFNNRGFTNNDQFTTRNCIAFDNLLYNFSDTDEQDYNASGGEGEAGGTAAGSNSFDNLTPSDELSSVDSDGEGTPDDYGTLDFRARRDSNVHEAGTDLSASGLPDIEIGIAGNTQDDSFWDIGADEWLFSPIDVGFGTITVTGHAPTTRVTGPIKRIDDTSTIIVTGNAPTVEVTREDPIETPTDITVHTNTPKIINTTGKFAYRYTAVVDVPPSHGNLYIYEGYMMYDPDEDYTGTDTIEFSYEGDASEGVSTSDSRTLSLTVQAYSNPIGIPTPPFGITETAPDRPASWTGPGTSETAGFYYINSGDGAATDSNTYGHPDIPRLTIPSTLAAGSYVEIHGTFSQPGPIDSVCSGTAENPVFIRGQDAANMAKIDDSIALLNSSYVIFEYLESISGSFAVNANNDHIVLRHCEAGVARGTTFGQIGSNQSNPGDDLLTDIVIYNCCIHHTDGANWELLDEPKDWSGTIFFHNARRCWFIYNESFNCRGDSVSSNTAGGTGTNPAQLIYIGKNNLFESQENAFDFKICYDVIVSQNRMWGMRDRGGDLGPVGVCHNDQAIAGHPDNDRIWLIFNEVYDNGSGYWLEAGLNVYVIGNIFYDLLNQEPTIFDAQSRSAWSLGTATNNIGYDNIHFVNNTVYNCYYGISHVGGSSDNVATIQNNIFSNIADIPPPETDNGWSVFTDVLNDDVVTIDHNLYYQPSGTINIEIEPNHFTDIATFQSTTGQGVGALEEDPLFTNPGNNDFTTPTLKPSHNVGIKNASAYDTFQSLYGLDIKVDFNGNPRPTNKSWTLGAYEAQVTETVNTIGTGGDFETIADWIAYLQGDHGSGAGVLTTAQVGQCLGQEFDEQVDMDNITTTSTNYVELTAHPDYRHDGRSNAVSGVENARIRNSSTGNGVNADVEHFRISWLEFLDAAGNHDSGDGTSSREGIKVNALDGEHFYHHLIVHNDGRPANTDSHGIECQRPGVNVYVYRCIVYGMGGDGIRVSSVADGSLVHNCTSCFNGRFGINHETDSCIVSNSACFENADENFNFSTGQSYNASGGLGDVGGPASGTGSTSGLDIADLFDSVDHTSGTPDNWDALDFTSKTSSTLKNSGTDLTNSGLVDIDVDIEGEQITDDTWDIGASEVHLSFTPTPGTITVTGHAPTVLGFDKTVDVNVGSVTVTGHGPTIIQMTEIQSPEDIVVHKNVSRYINTRDENDNRITVTITTSPSHATATALEGRILFIPDEDYTGTDSITYQYGTRSKTLTIEVAEITTMPIGIPAPSFGLTETPVALYTGENYAYNSGTAPYKTFTVPSGIHMPRYPVGTEIPYTHYVDNTHPSATDSGNAYGDTSAPRMTIPDIDDSTMISGSVVLVAGGTDSDRIDPPGELSWGADGTADDPVFFIGIPSGLDNRTYPRIEQDIIITGDYVILENFRHSYDESVQSSPYTVNVKADRDNGFNTTHHIVFRHFITHDIPWKGSTSSAFRLNDTASRSYNDGSITISSGVVTLTSGTWPSWSDNSDLIIPNAVISNIDGTDAAYYVASRDSDTQITLNDTSIDLVSSTPLTSGGLEIVEREPDNNNVVMYACEVDVFGDHNLLFNYSAQGDTGQITASGRLSDPNISDWNNLDVDSRIGQIVPGEDTVEVAGPDGGAAGGRWDIESIDPSGQYIVLEGWGDSESPHFVGSSLSDVSYHVVAINEFGSVKVAQDMHAFAIRRFARDIWILNCEGYGTHGDGFQVSGPLYDVAYDRNKSGIFPKNIYVGHCDFHHCRENPMDIKEVSNLIISQNWLHHVVDSDASGGAVCLTIHRDDTIPQSTWTLFNKIYNGGVGIRYSKLGGEHYCIGNIIWNMHETTVVGDPGNGANGDGIFVSAPGGDNSTPTTGSLCNCPLFLWIVHNTVYDCDALFSMDKITTADDAAIYIWNNILSRSTGTGNSDGNFRITADWGPLLTTDNVDVRNNILYQPQDPSNVRTGWNSIVGTGTLASSSLQANSVSPNLQVDPEFVNNDTSQTNPDGFDFHISNSSDAISAGVDVNTESESLLGTGIYDQFTVDFPTASSIAVDYDEVPRDSTPDIGAFQFATSDVEASIDNPGTIIVTGLAPTIEKSSTLTAIPSPVAIVWNVLDPTVTKTVVTDFSTTLKPNNVDDEPKTLSPPLDELNEFIVVPDGTDKAVAVGSGVNTPDDSTRIFTRVLIGDIPQLIVYGFNNAPVNLNHVTSLSITFRHLFNDAEDNDGTRVDATLRISGEDVATESIDDDLITSVTNVEFTNSEWDHRWGKSEIDGLQLHLESFNTGYGFGDGASIGIYEIDVNIDYSILPEVVWRVPEPTVILSSVKDVDSSGLITVTGLSPSVDKAVTVGLATSVWRVPDPEIVVSSIKDIETPGTIVVTGLGPSVDKSVQTESVARSEWNVIDPTILQVGNIVVPITGFGTITVTGHPPTRTPAPTTTYVVDSPVHAVWSLPAFSVAKVVTPDPVFSPWQILVPSAVGVDTITPSVVRSVWYVHSPDIVQIGGPAIIGLKVFINEFSSEKANSVDPYPEEHAIYRTDFVHISFSYLNDLDHRATEWEFSTDTELPNPFKFTVNTDSTGVLLDQVGNVKNGTLTSIDIAIDRTKDWYLRFRLTTTHGQGPWTESVYLPLVPRGVGKRRSGLESVSNNAFGAVVVSEGNRLASVRDTSTGAVVDNRK